MLGERTCIAGGLVVMFLIGAGASADETSFKQVNVDWDWVAREDHEVAEAWAPKPMLGKNFWYIAGERMHQYEGTKDEDFLRHAAPKFGHCYGMEHISPAVASTAHFGSSALLRRIAIREIEVYAGGKNVALDAQVSAHAVSGKVFHPQRANDGDKSATNVCHSSSVDYLDDHTGWIALDLGEEKDISRISVYHGYQWVPAVKKLCYITRDFVLQYWTGKQWRDIPGTRTDYNSEAVTNHDVRNVRTSKIRILVNKRGYPAVSFGYLSSEVRAKIPKDKPYIISGGTGFVRGFLVEGDKAFDCFLKAAVDHESFNGLPHKENFLGFMLGEWDSNFIQRWHQVKRDVEERRERIKAAGYKYPPFGNRDEAYDTMITRLFGYVVKAYMGHVVGFNGGTLFEHYTLEGGATVSFPECGCAPKSCQLVQMFARGASRQYQKPWGYYEAYFWMGDGGHTVVDFFKKEMTKHSTHTSGPDCGIPVSMGRRDLYMAYLCGATFLMLESEPVAFFKPSEKEKNLYELSPHGKVAKEVLGFAKRHPDRGVQYTPALVLLDYRHGYYTPRYDTIWGVLPRSKGDVMVNGFFHTLIRWTDLTLRRSWNSPYGDIFDVMLANPPSGAIRAETLNQYKVVFLVGDIGIDEELTNRLKRYVREGGTLILNASQASPLLEAEFLGARLLGEMVVTPAFDYQRTKLLTAVPLVTNGQGEVLLCGNEYGKGRVVLSTADYLLDKKRQALPSGNRGCRKPDYLLPIADMILDRVQSECVPFKVEGNVSFQFNRTKGGWLVILVNNEGVTKEDGKPEILDPAFTAEVMLRLPFRPDQTTELISAERLSAGQDASGSYLKMIVPAGDIKVLAIGRGK